MEWGNWGEKDVERHISMVDYENLYTVIEIK